jgi:hypothetical protein
MDRLGSLRALMAAQHARMTLYQDPASNYRQWLRLVSILLHRAVIQPLMVIVEHFRGIRVPRIGCDDCTPLLVVVLERSLDYFIKIQQQSRQWLGLDSIHSRAVPQPLERRYFWA